ncbi:MAG: hypothetical protein M1838_002454 [Thelocarpon superellum]|nr:MAG: hypothetical protein M1838_002454 [Thelocarpon superellum]
MASTQDDELGAIPSYPLYGVSFTLHRLSPLYQDPAGAGLLTSSALALHGRRFRDLLRGEVLRGVRVGLAGESDDGLRKAGAFVDCTWTVFGDEIRWAQTHSSRPDSPTDLQQPSAPADARGILVQVSYEQATYTALFLRSPEDVDPTDTDGSTQLPLLLTRMPLSLRETFLDYLATTFDTRFSPLTLRSDFLESCFEAFLATLTSVPAGEAHGLPSEALASIFRDVQVSLSFPAPAAPSLRSMDVTIPREDVLTFLEEGRAIYASQDPASSARPPPPPSRPTRTSGPFIAALSQYLQCHLALPMSHADVNISKIGCGAFLLGAEGKVKIARPTGPSDAADPVRTAVAQLVGNLIQRAQGTPLLGELFEDSTLLG